MGVDTIGAGIERNDVSPAVYEATGKKPFVETVRVCCISKY